MSRIGAEFYVEVHGILADPEVLGKSFRVDREGIKFRIDFPEAEDAFEFIFVSGSGDSDPREYSPTKAVVKQSESLVEIRLVRVVVNVESSLSAVTYDSSSDADKGQHDELLVDLRQRAENLAAQLGDLLRIEIDQYWVEPTGTYPRVVNMAGLIDIDAQQAFGHMLGKAGSIRVVDESSMVTAANLPRLTNRLNQGPLQADELLLAEAVYLANAAQPVAADRATLIAAIAVELRTKRLLRRIAQPDRVGILDLLVNSPQDWSMAAHSLFLKAIPVFLGQDAPTPEHKALAKRVQVLFRDRNGIVHRGESVSRDSSVKHVRTAAEAFAFLDGLDPERE